MIKCIVWGIGAEYDQYVNQLQYQVVSGRMSIEAFISKDKYCEYLDGKRVYCLDEIPQTLEYDYLIICNTPRFKEIKGQAVSLGINEKRILDIRIFEIPWFDIQKYVSLMEDPITIVADDCWGAEVYHYLHLPFSSPFILCFTMEQDYMYLLEHLERYLDLELTCYQDANISKGQYPIGVLGKEHPIKIYFNHACSFEEAKSDWNRRKERINLNHILIKMTIMDESVAQRFSKLPYKHKIGFFPNESKWEDVYSLPEWRWNDDYMRRYHGYNYADFVRNSARQYKVRQYDIFKLLTGDSGFMRRR